MRKGIVLTFLLLLTPVALILGVFFLLNNKRETPNLTQKTLPSPEIDTSNLRTYTNQKYSFSVQYPADLEVKEFHIAQNNSDTVNITKYEESGKCINIHVDPIDIGQSDLKEWLTQNTSGYGMPAPGVTLPPPTIYPYVNIYQKSVSGYWEEQGAEVLSKTVYIQNKNNTLEFSLSGCAAGDSYKYYPEAQETFEKVISTFKFTN